jgi:hypothetical protein
MLVIWSVSVVLFFTFAQNRAVWYALSVLPTLALLCGEALDAGIESVTTPAWVARGILFLAVSLSVGICLLKIPVIFFFLQSEFPYLLQTYASVIAFVLSVGVMILIGVWGMRKTRSSLIGIVVTQILLLGTCLTLARGEGEETVPLPKLVLQEPPAGLRLPDPIVRKNEWKGVQCGVQEPKHLIIRNARDWTLFWQSSLAPYSLLLSKIPVIDFEKDMVVGVFLGEKTTPNYEIDIRKIRTEERAGSNVLVVRYKEVAKMLGVFTPPFAIQPFHLKKVPAFTGDIIFEKQ